jgi:polysaccharide biosynthesis/export protein
MNANKILNRSHLARKFCRAKLTCFAALIAPLTLFALLIAGCTANYQSYPPTFSHVEDFFPPYTNALAQADIISITFRYSTNFNTVQKIGMDGMVNLEVVGQVKAEGKTVEQLQNELTVLYKSETKDDPITVKLVAAAAAVYVTGAVNHPGKIPMDRRMTVLDAISEAGGYDQYRAKLSRVSVLRVDGGTQRIFWLDLNRVLSGEDAIPFYLKPYDVVRVPTKTFNF